LAGTGVEDYIKMCLKETGYKDVGDLAQNRVHLSSCEHGIKSLGSVKD